jgi:uncharacterized protein (DUF1684 family)
MTDEPAPGPGIADRLALADWRRRVGELYADVRAIAATDPAEAWEVWRAEREALYRGHPQSPVPAAERPAFRARHWPYDDTLRFELAVLPPPDAFGLGGLGAALALPNSGAEVLSFQRVGAVELPLAAGPRRLALYWMAGYAGGLFLPFRDATNGGATYGAGRYLLDTAKSADLGGDPAAGTLVVDLNFAFHPSCAFDARWACPLAPPENRLDVAVEAGERLR